MLPEQLFVRKLITNSISQGNLKVVEGYSPKQSNDKPLNIVGSLNRTNERLRQKALNEIRCIGRKGMRAQALVGESKSKMPAPVENSP
jgi:precorrin-3B methylase